MKSGQHVQLWGREMGTGTYMVIALEATPVRFELLQAVLPHLVDPGRTKSAICTVSSRALASKVSAAL